MNARALKHAVGDDCFSASTTDPDLLSLAGNPGILVLAFPMKIMHMNQRAWELIRSMGSEASRNGTATGAAARDALPPDIRDASSHMFDLLQDRTEAKDWEQLELARAAGAPERPVRLRVFGIPDPRGRQYGRVVVILEEVQVQVQGHPEELMARFNLTNREIDVVRCLVKGWTNKEIANALKLAVPTVKEHIRHIMEKTHATTRTGILVSLILGANPVVR